MSIHFETWPEAAAIIIRGCDHVDAEAVNAMRQRTVELTRQTGFHNYLVDIRDLKSIAANDPFAAYELGDSFGKAGIAFSTRTAVILRIDTAARRQAEFLHTVELNRGRGDLQYVQDAAEALDWFDQPEAGYSD